MQIVGSGIRNDKVWRGVLIDVEEEEEENGDTEDEEVQGKANLYILDYSFDDRYYLDDDHSTNKFNSNQNDVCLCPILDFALST